jgi:hypothetical protein
MAIYVLRLRNGNCIMVDALTEEQARENARPLAASEIVTARELKAFAVQFALGDEGGFAGVLVDKKTIADLHDHEYPMLGAAHTQSYADFNASETDSATAPVLFNLPAQRHLQQWDERDKQIVRYAVEQERSRFA